MVKVKYTIQRLLILFLKLYRLLLSPLLGDCCRFEPNCSNYALAMIEYHGPYLGCYMALKRLLCCHPWHEGEPDALGLCEQLTYARTKSVPPTASP